MQRKSSLLLNLCKVFLLALTGTVPPIALAQSNQACEGAKAGSLACLTVDLTNSNLKAFGFPPVVSSNGDTGISLFAGQLSSAAPLPSPSSGIVYTFDPNTGVFTQSSTSYGPILSERADTIGRGRFSFGFVDQYFDFTKVDGIKASNIPVFFPVGANAYIEGSFTLHFRLNQFTMFGTYGLTKLVEVSIAAPVINSQLGGSLNEVAHFGPAAARASTTSNRSATGFGDLEFQLKANILRSKNTGFAMGVNVRTPTGDPYAMTGAGAAGVEPFLAASTTIRRRFAPHVNVGYQWNGQSLLAAAGGVETGVKRALPSSIPYAAGVEIAINRRITITEDMIGTELIHAERALVSSGEFSGALVSGVGFIHKSLNSTAISSGLKYNPGGHLLLTVNLLTRVNDGGLRAAVVPLIGLSYMLRAPYTASSPRITRDTGNPAQPLGVPVASMPKPPMPPPSVNTAPPSSDTSADALKDRQRSYQRVLDRMVGELGSQAHFASAASPKFISFHNGLYLQLSVTTALPKTAGGSQYKLAALAFDQHIAHLIRPVLEILKARDDFDGISFSTSVTLAGDQPPDGNSLAVEFIFPLSLLHTYAQFDSTGQQLINGSFVLINGERVSLNLQRAESGFQSQ